MSMTFGTLFAGGGLADLGWIQAGWSPLWAVERDPDTAAVYRANLGDHVIVADARSIRWRDLPRPDAIWASPPCQAYSVAGAFSRVGVAEDLTIADALVAALCVLEPSLCVLENVVPYRRSRALSRIRAALDMLGYWSVVMVLDAADFETPQTRRRMVVLATHHRMIRPVVSGGVRSGWMTAAHDLIPSLPRDMLPDWVRARGIMPAGEPFLVNGMYAANGRDVVRRLASEPAMTVTATAGVKRPWRIWDGATVRRATPRLLARFQGVPDAYRLPDAAPLACRVIGNGVPPPVARALAFAMGNAP